MSRTLPAHGLDEHDDGLSELLRSPGYRTWRDQVDAVHGCAAPVHLRGSSRILDTNGRTVAEQIGTVLAPCGNRRAAVCPSCSDRYCADAFHLLRAGLAGDTTKDVPPSVVEHPRAFVTLTAPSFGPVHTRRLTARGHVIPCACGDRHSPDDPRVGTARDPETYDYAGAVLWQAHAGGLWSRFTTDLRRALAAELGVPSRAFAEHARLSFAKVAEYQRRGLVHFHAVVRLDGPDGPGDPPPADLGDESLRAAVRHAAAHATLATTRPDDTPLALRWGAQLDVRPVPPATVRQLEDADGNMTDAALAGYIAKYATKGTGAHEGTDRRIHDIAHVAHLGLPEHHRRMIETAWELGGHDRYDGLHLRKWAHMLGFRGHFLTKSRRYSSTFTALRAQRRSHRLAAELSGLRDPDDPDAAPIDPTTVTVVNHWWPVRFGHRNDAERELAAAIAERHRDRHRPTTRSQPQIDRRAA